MYRRLSAVLFPVMTIALIGTAVWGYQVNQEKNAVLIKAENQYQRAFHDLSYYVDKLHNELGNALAVNGTSQDFHKKCLVNAWRITSQAQNEVNQLPLSLMPFNKTEEFLSNIANFTYRAAIRDLSKQPLSSDEMKTLTTLYEHSKEISGELRNVQSQVIANNLRWMDVEVALASTDKQMDNTIVDGFMTVDKKVSEYDEINWGPSMASMFQKRNFTMLSGEDMSVDAIKQKAAEFLGLQDISSMSVVENGAGTEYNSYSVAVVNPDTGQTIALDYTKKGGKLIWFMNERTVSEKKISAEQARDVAAPFLEQHGYPNMEAVSVDEYQNVATLMFVTRKNDVLIFPEKLTVQVALDNGQVTGLQASDYVYEQKNRELPPPTLTLDEARKKLNTHFKTTDEELALIKNDIGEEVICYQFVGQINGSAYRMYINGNTGMEEKIEVIEQADADVTK